jgi:hypothetical protein
MVSGSGAGGEGGWHLAVIALTAIGKCTGRWWLDLPFEKEDVHPALFGSLSLSGKACCVSVSYHEQETSSAT